MEQRRALPGDDLIRSYFVAQAQLPSALSDVDLAALTPYHRALLVSDGVWVPETQFGVITRQLCIRGSVLRGRRVVGRGQGR